MNRVSLVTPPCSKPHLLPRFRVRDSLPDRRAALPLRQAICPQSEPAQFAVNGVPAPLWGVRGGAKSVGHIVSDTLRKGDDTSSPLTPTVRHSKIELITQF